MPRTPHSTLRNWIGMLLILLGICAWGTVLHMLAPDIDLDALTRAAASPRR